MRTTMLLSAIVVFAGAGGSAVAQNAARRGDPGTGQQLALSVCDACHTVAAKQKRQEMPLEDYGPSFFDIANRPDTNQQSLEAFLSHPHPYVRMPLPGLTPSQIADVSAYILSLRRRR